MRPWPLAAAILVTLLAGCAPPPIDPGDQTTAIQFENDLRQPVVLKLCGDDACHGFNYADDIAPGDSNPENIYYGADAFINRWLVADSDGRTLGCLPIRLRHAYEHERALISMKVACPGEAPITILHAGSRLPQF